jgi:hypothetical protein
LTFRLPTQCHWTIDLNEFPSLQILPATVIYFVMLRVGQLAPGSIRTNQTIQETGFTRQTLRDLASVKRRIANCGESFDVVKKSLKNVTKTTLLTHAQFLVTQFSFPPCDRVCRRNRDALICWFCANKPNVAVELQQRVVLPHLVDLLPDLFQSTANGVLQMTEGSGLKVGNCI